MPKGRTNTKPNQYPVAKEVILTMTNRTALGTVHVGNTLDIQFRPGPPAFLVVMTKDGRAVGAAVFPTMSEVAKRIKYGCAFVPDGLAVRGTHCRVRVRPKRSLSELQG